MTPSWPLRHFTCFLPFILRSDNAEPRLPSPSLGDLLGSAIQNLHQLLRLPYGCGEQNMALLAPNIYILDYLNKTGQLTEEVRSKAVGYLTTGEEASGAVWVCSWAGGGETRG